MNYTTPSAFHTFPRPVLETLSLLRNLTVREGYCYAKNAWLAAARKVSESTITRHIRQLVSAGLFVWRRVGKERHLFPVFPGKKSAPTPEKMTRQRAGNAQATPGTHAGATESQTKETKVTKETQQQTPGKTISDAPVADRDSVCCSPASLDSASEIPCADETPDIIPTPIANALPIPEPRHPNPELSGQTALIAAELQAQGVSASVAKEIAAQSAEKARKLLAWVKSRQNVKNAAGLICAAWRGDWNVEAGQAKREPGATMRARMVDDTGQEVAKGGLTAAQSEQSLAELREMRARLRGRPFSQTGEK